jgi:site-specific recombinase XerD
VEFFTANIRNKNTRLAYAQAVGQFLRWCEKRRFTLELIEPVVVAAYVEELMLRFEPPTVKQHLAAVRMLFDYLVVGQVIPMNPASSVRGPKHIVKKRKTPVLDAKEARELLDSIPASTVAGLRDRAIIAVMVYSFARVSATVGMDADDYLQRGKRYWFRLREKAASTTRCPPTPRQSSTSTRTWRPRRRARRPPSSAPSTARANSPPGG